MKWTYFVLAAALSIGVVGCGDKEKEKGSVTGKDDKKLTLTPPSDVSIKQGGTESIKVKIGREKFDDAVDVTFGKLPEGVSLKETDTKFDKGTTEKTFNLVAKDDATVQDGHRVTVTAKHEDKKIEKEFTVNVKKK